MRVLWIGYGQAGGKIVNTLRGLERKHYRAIAINTEVADLVGLKNVDERLIIANHKFKGRGVGAKPEIGSDAADKSRSRMMDMIGRIAQKFAPEALWIAGGLAGGTGAGGSPILAQELRATYDVPIYGLGALPFTSEMPMQKKGLQPTNAIKSLELWRECMDNVLLIDNQRYEDGYDQQETVQEMYARINIEVAKALTTILNAGEGNYAAQEVFSTPEVTATLGKGGKISTIGYRVEVLEMTNSMFWKKPIDPDENLILETVKRSIDEKSLSFPCNIATADAAGLVIYGRPQHLYSRALLSGKSSLEERLPGAEIRYGDYPDTKALRVASVALISGITDTPRLDQLKENVADLKEIYNNAPESDAKTKRAS